MSPLDAPLLPLDVPLLPLDAPLPTLDALLAPLDAPLLPLVHPLIFRLPTIWIPFKDKEISKHLFKLFSLQLYIYFFYGEMIYL